ncbi:BRCT domain-containing protein [Runella rosea]|nr:BRCT domain-containing protein [Runella rosea]
MNTAKFDKFDSKSYMNFCSPAIVEKDLNNLYGLIQGIKADGAINDSETEYLKKWAYEVGAYHGRSPYKDICQCIERITEDGIIDKEEIDDLEWLCEQFLNTSNPYYNLITSGIQQLSGILSGIEADGDINDSEIQFLKDYADSNEFLRNTWPYDSVLEIVHNIIEDRDLTNDYRQKLQEIIKSTSIMESATPSNRDVLTAMDASNAVLIKLPESTFCITGNSPKYTRREIAEMIELYGGFVQDSVSAKLHYLVVCDQKNACWAFASYGRKIEKVKELQRKGKNVEVIYEEDLYMVIESFKGNS